MRFILTSAVILALAPQSAVAQSVPENVHSDARGPSEMCGLAGKDALDLIEKARNSKTLKPLPTDSDRFEVFQSELPRLDQLVVTKPSEPAHPAVTCRHGFYKNGALHMKRSMRCDAGRAECDALFIEFQKLDEAMIKSLQSPQ